MGSLQLLWGPPWHLSLTPASQQEHLVSSSSECIQSLTTLHPPTPHAARLPPALFLGDAALCFPASTLVSLECSVVFVAARAIPLNVKVRYVVFLC